MNVLIDAFEKTGKDPKFVEMWNKMVSDVCEVSTGQDTKAILSDCLDVEPEVVQYIDNLKRKLDIIK